MNSPQFFAGFVELEALLATHRSDTPLYFATPTELRPTNIAHFRGCQTYVMVADIQGNVCRYWRMSLGQYADLGGHPLDPKDMEKARKGAESMHAQLTRVLREDFAIEVQQALVAIPPDLPLIIGITNLVTYDAASGQFVAAARRLAAVGRS